MINIFGAKKDTTTDRYVVIQTQLVNNVNDGINCITPPIYECVIGALNKQSFIFMEHYKPGLGHSAITAFSEATERMIMDNFLNVKPGDVIADIGSGYGIYTLRSLLMGARFVYTFEPIQEFCDTLVANIRLNKWIHNASILYNPLWSSETTIDLEDKITMSAKRTMFSNKYKTMTLDGFFDEYGDSVASFDRLNIVKIDVEGSELEVIKGAVNTIRRFKPRMIIEIHPSKELDVIHELIQTIDSIGIDANILFISIDRFYAIVDFIEN